MNEAHGGKFDKVANPATSVLPVSGWKTRCGGRREEGGLRLASEVRRTAAMTYRFADRHLAVSRRFRPQVSSFVKIVESSSCLATLLLGRWPSGLGQVGLV